MAYVDTGPRAKPAIVFLHGNPASSYIWRNVIPLVADRARCIAPDLIGMGDSAKPPITYDFADQSRYLGAFLDAIVPDGKLVLVVHDFGSQLGLDWAQRHRGRVAGLVLMEFLAGPIASWNDFPAEQRATFQAFRDPVEGRRLIKDENVFIEQKLQEGMIRPLSDAEMEAYQSPFPDPASREPIFQIPSQIPIAGQPAEVADRVQRYHEWLLTSDVPKLFFWASPGELMPESMAGWYAEHMPNTRAVPFGPGRHYLQEDNPDLIGNEIAAWVKDLDEPSAARPANHD